MPAWLVPAAMTAGAWGLDKLFGNKSKAVVPKDMQGMRQQTIDLLMSLLQPGAFDKGGKGNDFFFGAGGNRMEQLANQPSPEMNTYDFMRPILEGMMTGTGPQFERDISTANSQGGRFGSANAVLRGEALRNLFNGRQQTASTLGMLAGQAGSAQFDRTSQVQNQRLQLLAGLLGMGGQASLSMPVESGGGGGFMDLMKIFMTMQGGGGGKTGMPGATKTNVPSWGMNA